MATEQEIQDFLIQEPGYKEGLEIFKNLDTNAHHEAEELAKLMIEKIVRKEDEFNLSTALLATAKTLTHLTSYLYDTEEEFLADVKKARSCIVTDIVPALLDPQPCGKCENCKNGNPAECKDPQVRAEYTETRFLPLVCDMLIEYDMFNKVLHMHALKEKNAANAAQQEAKEQDPMHTKDAEKNKETE